MLKVALSIATLFLSCVTVQAQNNVPVPILIELNQVFAAGTNTYLTTYMSPEIDNQISAGCGRHGLLKSLDLHYTITEHGGDSRDLKMSGTAICFKQEL